MRKMTMDKIECLLMSVFKSMGHLDFNENDVVAVGFDSTDSGMNGFSLLSEVPDHTPITKSTENELVIEWWEYDVDEEVDEPSCYIDGFTDYSGPHDLFVSLEEAAYLYHRGTPEFEYIINMLKAHDL